VALTRKQLYAATYAALCIAALLLAIFAPKRKHNVEPDLPVPEAQLGVGSGCEANELPMALDSNPPATNDPSAPKDETAAMRRARYRITACVLHKLWPTASLQFRWMQDGGGQFDLVFPNNAYRRASVISMSQLSRTDQGRSFGAFVWLPHQRELQMPPVVVTRADAEGNISYYRAFSVDDDAQVSEEKTPQWIVGNEHDFRFTYHGDYGDAHVAWEAMVDVASAEMVKRVPVKVDIEKEQWLLTEERMDASGLVMRAVRNDAKRSLDMLSIRVRCESSNGANCVVSARDLIEQLQQIR
jgi:hypothetical protein